MTALFVGIGTALWLGILTSISPCPLASNIAAISFLGRNVASPRRVLLAGLIYSLGRALTYVLVGAFVVSSVLSIPAVSLFLQGRMNQILGPLLVVIGVGMFGWLRLPLPTWNVGQAVGERTARAGVAGAGLLGILFALSFCPVSAGLFFGALIPLAVNSHSRVFLPALFGIGTGLPVTAFAVLLVFGARGIGRAFSAMTRLERAARPLTGAVFVLAGLYLTAVHVFGVDLQ
jgi:cytochrome c-type biogenesis protein